MTGSADTTAPNDRQQGVLVEVLRDGVGIVTLTNPTACNALTLAMWVALDHAVRALSDDPRVLVVVIRGEGIDFSSGADIHELPDDPDEFHRVHLAAEHTIATCPKPVIAAIRGHCVGGGCEVAVAADFRFAGPEAVFGVTASRLGIVYPTEPTRRLMELVGVGEARRLLYAGELLDTAWALRVGLVTEVVAAPEDVDDRALAFARLLTTRSQVTIAAAKQVTSGRSQDVGWPTTDYTEGVRAFREHRAPVFPSASRLSP